ncbi:unnamed protein product [Adineta ricciae]|uniref:Uncharacterized protein n=1 Tax=Adineta ricciae TaxID=249248 RepID=A0A815HH72_ADIRI|nr:unnamed protein product [Adineta ricciae]CAF1638063.1 unnamed protein product [Adineta ricciae]
MQRITTNEAPGCSPPTDNQPCNGNDNDVDPRNREENRDDRQTFGSALQLITIIMVYYDELGTGQLENFVNTILDTDYKAIDI